MSSLLPIGQILSAHFEAVTARWRILLKHAFGIALFAFVSYFSADSGFWFSITAAFGLVLLIHV